MRFILALSSAQLLAAVFGVSILLQSDPVAAAQTVPYKINFQGRLTDNSGNALSDGLYNVKFRLFDASASGTNVWEGDRVMGASDHRIQVTNGLFNIQFGDTTQGDPALSPTLFSNGTYPLYLEVELPTPATATCAVNGCASFTEGAMTPRQPLASTPYAFSADTLDGLDSADFGQITTANNFTGTNTFSKSGGTGIILSGTPASGGSLLQVGSALSSGNSSGTLLSANGSFSGDLINLQVSNTTKLKVDNSGNLTLAGTVSGTTINASLGVSTADISQTGTYLLQSASDSSAAFQINSNAAARTILKVGTSDTKITADANFIVSSSVGTPSLTSVAFASNSGGTLSGSSGSTYFYKISAIVGGVETAASTEAWVNTSSFTPLSTGSLTAPTAAVNAAGAGALGQSQVYSYKVTFVSANGETTASAASNTATTTNTRRQIDLTNIPTGPAGTTARKLYRTTGGGSTYLLVNTGATLSNNTTTSLTDGTADNTLGAGTPSANTATTNSNTVTVTFPSFPGASSYRIYRGTSTRGESTYQTAASSPFTDTGAAGTAGSFIDATAGRVGIGTTAPGYALDVVGNISADGAYIQSGNVGQSSSCGAGSTYSGMTISGGIVTGVGSCASIGGGSASATLQSAYDNSTSSEISLGVANGGLTVRDTSGGLGANLLEVQDNAGTTTYLAVSSTGIAVTGSGSFSAGVNINSGQTYKINNTQISTTALSDVNSITMQGNTFNGASQLVQLNGSTQLPAVSGTNLTSLNPTNLATGSGAITLAAGGTGNLTLNTGGGTGNTVVLGSNVTTLQKAASGLTIDVANAGASTLTVSNSNGSNVANLTVTGGITIGSGKAVTVGSTAGVSKTCNLGEFLESMTTLGGILTGGTCSTPVGGGGASTSLSNLGTTSINASLTPDSTANNRDLGTTGSLWRTGYFNTSLQAPLLQSAASTALTITAGAASTWSTSSGDLKIQSGSGILQLGSTTSITADGALSIDSNTTSNLNLGTSASAKIITIGNTTGATAVNIDAGTNGINIGDNANTNTIDIGGVDNGGTDTINIGTNATGADAVTIGSTNATSKVILTGGVNSTTTNLGVVIGGGTTVDTSQINLVLDTSSTFTETAGTCTTGPINTGALYYNSASTTVRTCINGNWEDVITTAGLGIITYGVIPDSGPDPGNWVGNNATLANNGPCKVYFGSAAKNIRWTACTAYSGGRKVTVAAQTTDFLLTTSASSWTHICLTGANGQPAPSAFGTENANLPAFSATAPVLCLADISTGNGQGQITGIYDTRTFTTSTKELVNNVTANPGLGMIAVQSTTAGTVNTSAATSGSAFVRGVIVAATAGTQSAGTINTIISTAGPAYVKATAGSVQGFVETGNGRAGLAITTTTLPTLGYANLGLALSAFSNACGTLADTCRTSLAVNLNLR